MEPMAMQCYSEFDHPDNQPHSIRNQKSRLHPCPLPKPHQQKRHGQEHQGNKRQHRRAPPHAQLIIQPRRHQRKGRAGHTPQADGRSDGGRGVDPKGIDEIAEGWEDGGGYTEAENRGRDDGSDPLDVGLHRPAVPEEGDGDDEAAYDHRR